MINVSSALLKDRDLDENGDSYIPASQRPDGTWRKARRVKEGYVPQEEVPLYESKGKKFLNRQQAPAEPVKIGGLTGHKTIPGLFIEDKEKSKSKKKSKKVDELANDISKMKVSEPTKPKESPKTSDSNQVTDPAKKLKNLKKRLREVEALEQKMKNGQIAKPEPEQLAKIQRKTDLIMQIDEMEKQLM